MGAELGVCDVDVKLSASKTLNTELSFGTHLHKALATWAQYSVIDIRSGLGGSSVVSFATRLKNGHWERKICKEL